MNAPLVGIIGSGNIGSGVARMATAAGMPVVLANSRGPESLVDLVADLGSTASASATEDAISRADIVVLAMPFGVYSDLPALALSSKVVVDATNYYPDRDGHVPSLDNAEFTSSELLSQQWPEAFVVKGLNNVDFVRLPMLTRPSGDPARTALPIAGNDTGTKATVINLLDTLGFDALDLGELGELGEGWRSQPDTPIYVTPYYRQNDQPADDPMQQFMAADPVPVPAEQARTLASAATR